jgi:hypothetical protein
VETTGQEDFGHAHDTLHVRTEADAVAIAKALRRQWLKPAPYAARVARLSSGVTWLLMAPVNLDVVQMCPQPSHL